MSKHVAFITQPDQFERFELGEPTDGRTIRYGYRTGSKTREGMAYEFAADAHSREDVLGWLDAKHIRPVRLDLSAEEPAFGPLDMEALEEGDHTDKNGRKVAVTSDFLRTLAENTVRLIREGKLRPPVKLGHDPDQSSVKRLFPDGGEPALGWIGNAQVAGRKLMLSAKQVPAKFRESVRNGSWRTRSVEIHNDYRGEGPAIVGVAFLGATRPAVPTLADLVGLSASDVETQLTTLSLFDEGTVLCFMDSTDSVEGESAPGGPDAQVAEDEPKDTKPKDPPEEDKDMSDELKARVAELEEQTKAAHKAAMQAVADTLEFCVGDTLEPGQLEDEKANVMALSSVEAAQRYVASVRKRPKVNQDRTKPLGSGQEPKTELSERANQIWQFSESRRKDDGRKHREGGRTDVGGMAVCQEEAEHMALCEKQMQLMGCDYLTAYTEVNRMRPDLTEKIQAARWGGGN